MKLEERPIECVAWLDHSSWRQSRAWEDPDKMTLYPTVVRTFGAVIEEGEHHIIIASTIAPNVGKVSSLQCVVKGAIVSRYTIEEPLAK